MPEPKSNLWDVPPDDARVLPEPVAFVAGGTARVCSSVRDIEAVLSHHVRFACGLSDSTVDDEELLRDEFERVRDLTSSLEAGLIRSDDPEVEELVFSPCAIAGQWAPIFAALSAPDEELHDARLLSLAKYLRYLTLLLQRLGRAPLEQARSPNAELPSDAAAIGLEGSMTLQAPLNLADALTAPDMPPAGELDDAQYLVADGPGLGGVDFDDYNGEADVAEPGEAPSHGENVIGNSLAGPFTPTQAKESGVLDDEQAWIAAKSPGGISEIDDFDDIDDFGDIGETGEHAEQSPLLADSHDWPAPRLPAMPLADALKKMSDSGDDLPGEIGAGLPWFQSGPEDFSKLVEPPENFAQPPASFDASWDGELEESQDPPNEARAEPEPEDSAARRRRSKNAPRPGESRNGWTRLMPGQDTPLRLSANRATEILLAEHRFKLRLGRRPAILDAHFNKYLLCEGPNYVGRAPDNDVVVEDAYSSISRVHLLIEIEQGQVLFLRDSSAHGTYVPTRLLNAST